MDGHVLLVSPSMAVYLLTPDCCLLNNLGALLPFEIAIGLNGAVWIKTSASGVQCSGPHLSAASCANYIIIRTSILKAELLLASFITAVQRDPAGTKTATVKFNMQVEVLVQKLLEMHRAKTTPM